MTDEVFGTDKPTLQQRHSARTLYLGMLVRMWVEQHDYSPHMVRSLAAKSGMNAAIADLIRDLADALEYEAKNPIP